MLTLRADYWRFLFLANPHTSHVRPVASSITWHPTPFLYAAPRGLARELIRFHDSPIRGTPLRAPRPGSGHRSPLLSGAQYGSDQLFYIPKSSL